MDDEQLPLCPKCGQKIAADLRLCPACALTDIYSDITEDDVTNASTSRRSKPAPADPDASMDSPEGYVIDSLIARGGMGLVYKAQQTALGRVVALKVLATNLNVTDRAEERFQLETETLAALEHAHIVPVYDVGRWHNRPFVAMKWVDGLPLDKWMKHALRQEESTPERAMDTSASGSLLRRAVGLFATVCRAIHHAHQSAFLHRDIKPGNIMIDADETPYVTDFGLARRLDGDTSLTMSGEIVGTPAYMSPEQARGDSASLTVASDIFSLGSTLYWIIAGTPPFPGDSSIDVIRRIQETEPSPPSSTRQGLGLDLENVCLKCLRKNPESRYPNALELAEDLERWLRHEPVLARRQTEFERLAAFCRRKPAIAALTALSLALLVAFVTHLLLSRSNLTAALEESVEQTEIAKGQTHFADQQRTAAETARRELEETLFRLKLRDIEAAFRSGKSAAPIADLAQLARERPDDPVLKQRLAGELATGPFAQLVNLELKHPEPVTRIVYSADGRKIATGSEDGKVRLFDAHTGKPLLEPIEIADAPVRSLKFDPTGDWLTAVAASVYKTLEISAAEPQVVMQGFVNRNGWASLSPDRRYIAVSDNGKLQIQTVPDGRPIMTATKSIPKIMEAWSPDSLRYLICGTWGNIHRFDTESKKKKTIALPFFRSGTPALLFNQAGDKFITVDHANAAVIWNTQTLKKTLQLRHPNHVSAAAYNAEKKLAATGDDNGVIQFWQGDEFELQANVIRTGEKISKLHISNDADRILAITRDARGSRALVYNVLMASRSVEFPLWSELVACDPNFRTAAATTDPRTVRLWSLGTAAKVARKGFNGFESARSIHIDALESCIGIVTDNAKVKIANLPDIAITGSVPRHHARPPDLAFHPTAKLALVTGVSRVTIIKPTRRGGMHAEFSAGSRVDPIKGAAFLRSGEELVVSMRSHSRVYPFGSFDEFRRIEHPPAVQTAYSVQHDQLCLLNEEGILTRIDLSNPEAQRTTSPIPGTGWKSSEMGISAKGRWLWRISEESKLTLASLASPHATTFPAQTETAAVSVAFNSEETRLFVISPLGSGRFYSLNDESIAPEQELLGDQFIQGHFIRDGKALATISKNKTIEFWDAETGLPCRPAILLDRTPTCFAITTSAERILVCDAVYTDRIIQPWEELAQEHIAALPDLAEAVASARRLSDGRLIFQTFDETESALRRLREDYPDLAKDKALHPWIRRRIEFAKPTNETAPPSDPAQ